MAQVDFYVLPENGNQEHFACALVQKAWKQENNIFINTRSRSAATALDDLLWTFKDISFLPHCVVTDDNAGNTPIVIGHSLQMDSQIPDHTTVMINLSNQIPPITNKIERILEIVAGNEDERQQSRERYAEYRDQRHKLNSHRI